MSTLAADARLASATQFSPYSLLLTPDSFFYPNFSNFLHISPTSASAIPPLFVNFYSIFLFFNTLKHFSKLVSLVFTPKMRLLVAKRRSGAVQTDPFQPKNRPPRPPSSQPPTVNLGNLHNIGARIHPLSIPAELWTNC